MKTPETKQELTNKQKQSIESNFPSVNGQHSAHF